MIVRLTAAPGEKLGGSMESETDIEGGNASAILNRSLPSRKQNSMLTVRNCLDEGSEKQEMESKVGIPYATIIGGHPMHLVGA